MRLNLGQIGGKALDLLYPPSLYCNCCGNLIDDSRTYHLCDHCLSHIRFDGQPVRRIDDLKVLRCTQYGLYERTLIFALKYYGKKYIARDLGEIMADRLSLAGVKIDLIVPVPMFSAKEKQRGFNHAALMGKYLGRRKGIKSLEHGLLRNGQTLPMRGLSPTERAINVKDKFEINPRYFGAFAEKRILLIDDFYTTGSTARACCKALLKGNPKEVYFLSFAAK